MQKIDSLIIGYLPSGLDITIHFENENTITTTVKTLLDILSEKEFKAFKREGEERFEKSIKEVLLLGRNGICNSSLVTCFEELKNMKVDILNYFLKDKVSTWDLKIGKITKFSFYYDKKDYDYKIKENK